jgi:hypothetical protein
MNSVIGRSPFSNNAATVPTRYKYGMKFTAPIGKFLDIVKEHGLEELLLERAHELSFFSTRSRSKRSIVQALEEAFYALLETGAPKLSIAGLASNRDGTLVTITTLTISDFDSDEDAVWFKLKYL